MNFSARLIIGTISVLAAAVIILDFGIGRSLRSELERDTRLALERDLRLIRDNWPRDSLQWNRVAAEFANSSGLRITAIDSAGRVRAESEVSSVAIPRLENHASRPEVQAALRGAVGWNKRFSATLGQPMMYVAAPGGPGVLRVAMSIAQVDEIVNRADGPIVVATAVALRLGCGLAVVFSRRVTGPLGEIAAAARAIAAGETPHFPLSGIPDIDRLSADLRATHQQLVERFDALKQRQSETAALVDAMAEGVLSCDAGGRVTTANPAARRLLGYRQDESLPNIAILFHAKEAREVVRAMLRGESVTGREIVMGGDTYLLNARPLPTGGAVMVLQDLTRLKHLETVRRDFVANVSHELKTPLTAISGYAETLLSDQPTPDIERRFLETILSNARRMQRLVDDQLDLSRIESGTWTPSIQMVAVEPAIRDAWALAATSKTHSTLIVDIRPNGDRVPVDPETVRPVLRNLFENAIRHTPPAGTITVTVRPEGNGTLLTVADTGSGIPAEHLPRIFERFYRVDPGRSRAEGGTGLGLAIVRHLVEAQGGRVWAESELGQGTAIHWWMAPLPQTMA